MRRLRPGPGAQLTGLPRLCATHRGRWPAILRLLSGPGPAVHRRNCAAGVQLSGRCGDSAVQVPSQTSLRASVRRTPVPLGSVVAAGDRRDPARAPASLAPVAPWLQPGAGTGAAGCEAPVRAVDRRCAPAPAHALPVGTAGGGPAPQPGKRVCRTGAHTRPTRAAGRRRGHHGDNLRADCRTAPAPWRRRSQRACACAGARRLSGRFRESSYRAVRRCSRE